MNDKPSPKGESDYRRDWKAGNWFFWAIIAVGITIRLAAYLHCRSFWLDEAGLALNVLRLDFGQLLGRLDNLQVAPPLFLVLSKLAYELFGGLEYSLRLLPLIAGCVTLLLLARLVLRVAPGFFGLCAILLYAFSVLHIDWATTFKHFASDQLCAMLVLYGAFLWDSASSGKRYVAAAALPTTLWLSYTSAFALSGLVLAAAASVLRRKEAHRLGALTVLVGSLCASAYSLYTYSAQFSMRHGQMVTAWHEGFPSPPIGTWLIRSVLDLFGTGSGIIYAAGLILAICTWGFLEFARSSTPSVSFLAAGTLASAIFASLLHVYPLIGGRLSAYWAPIVVVLLAKGFESGHKAVVGTKAARFVRGLAIALLLATGLGLFYSGPDLFARQEVRYIAQELQQRPDDDSALLVTSQNCPLLELYGGSLLNRPVIPLEVGRFSLELLQEAWLRAGKPNRFWVLVSLSECDDAREVGLKIAPFCRAIDAIHKGKAEAYLLELRPTEEWPRG